MFVLLLSPVRALEGWPGPDEIFGELFADVQRAKVFPYQKTFADAVPKEPVPTILAAYAEAKRQGTVDLRAFVEARFLVPEPPETKLAKPDGLEAHVRALWPTLRRAPDAAVPGSSLLPLPHPYIVPGGRFREIYYWDSYFTMLGLRVSGEEATIESMVDNFAHLLRAFGHIPNGNRTYYLSRSQPPFFALMVRLLAERRGPVVYVRYLDALRAEHAYWSDATAGTKHRVTLPDGGELTRYYDQADAPRPEAFLHDEAVLQASGGRGAELYRQLRSACESGWDFSTRWLGEGTRLESIRTLELVPVDLNCLLYELEQTLALACGLAREAADAERFAAMAARRKAAILRACWSEEARFFCDYDLAAGRPATALTLAGVFPLYCGIATPEQAAAVKHAIETRFLRPGGVVTTLVNSGQQWDAPNGWAPLQWVTIQALENYGHGELAAEIARRWTRLNADVFARTGKLMEKYNVEDLSLEAGGGEYPGQDGFGWTNGVLLRLLQDYPAVTSAGKEFVPRR
ncbi:MAG TPA: alpha,alpha-trehalase TreF [Opitutus sp.]|nr:alpha,alpha-trehalase TreF [Opitutus sp.]